MSNSTALPIVAPQSALDPLHASVLAELSRLGKTHLLAYSLACGELILREFWNGDAAAYSSRDATKHQTFARFAEACADLLADLGQSPDQLRRSVQAHLVWRGLPASTRDRLQLTHLTELARCHEPTQRARLALEVAERGWTKQQLRDAVTASNNGQWYDTDPEVPGVQPPVVPERQAAFSPARWVNRTEKLVPQLTEWSQLGAELVPNDLTAAQRTRLLAALDAAEAQLRLVRGRLAQERAG